MFIDLDKAVTVNMFGKHSQKTGFWNAQINQAQNQQSITSNLLIYVTDGSFNIKIADKIYLVSNGDTIVIPAGTIYQPRESDGCSYYFFHFTASIIESSSFLNIGKSLLRFVEYENDGYTYNYYGSTSCIKSTYTVKIRFNS